MVVPVKRLSDDAPEYVDLLAERCFSAKFAIVERKHAFVLKVRSDAAARVEPLDFPAVGRAIAGLALLTDGAVLFLGTAGEALAEAFILVLVGLALTLTAGSRIAYVRLAALYTVSKDAITARYGVIARRSQQIQVDPYSWR